MGYRVMEVGRSTGRCFHSFSFLFFGLSQPDLPVLTREVKVYVYSLLTSGLI